MKEYPKINSVYKRDEATHKFLEGQWSEPEFEYLAYSEWEWTEKVDGTNVRVIWLPKDLGNFSLDSIPDDAPIGVSFKGKQETSQMPAFLFTELQKKFPVNKFQEHFKDVPICLYGEGFGAGIQKAGKLYYPRANFVLFDVWIDGWWLKRADIVDIALKLGINVVPVVGHSNIYNAIELVRSGFKSKWGDFQAEGLVGKTPLGLKNRKGERIITKIKTKDFYQEPKSDPILVGATALGLNVADTRGETL